MFNRQLKANIKEIDKQIGELNKELSVTVDDNEYESTIRKIEDLTKVRGLMTDSKVKESNKEVLISGAFGIAAVLMVLKYEKTDIVTSKAFGIATKLFRG